MRENIGLFKAKDIKTNEWVEGFYFNFNARVFLEDKPTTRLKDCIVLNDTAELYIEIEIDPETLCECTGLKDKNGKLIFENDILSAYGSYDLTVVWDEGDAMFYAEYQGIKSGHEDDDNDDFADAYNFDYYEIIGNKFEEVESEN